MFFCGPCREARKWPESISVSRGPCEVCGHVSNCYDVPSKYLPIPSTEDGVDRDLFDDLE